MSIERLFDAV